MSFNLKDFETLTDKAVKISPNEFIRLVEDTVQLLAKERERVKQQAVKWAFDTPSVAKKLLSCLSD